MKSKLFFAIFPALLLLFGCNKPNPEAYKLDPVLQDFQQQLAATNASLEALKKQAESTTKDLNTSAPQSGQATLHRKKLDEMNNRISNLEQQIRYWKIKIESQAKESQAEYLKSHRENKTWPDPERAEAYFAEKRLRQAKIVWDQKERIKEYEHGNSQKAPAGGGHEAPAGH